MIKGICILIEELKKIIIYKCAYDEEWKAEGKQKKQKRGQNKKEAEIVSKNLNKRK